MANISTALQNFICDAIAAQFEGGTLSIYTGSKPASANSAPSGTLLLTITLPTPAFDAAVAGVADKDGVWSGSGVDTGTAGWGRLADAGGTLKADGSVGVEFVLDDNAIVPAAAITCTDCNITVPSGE